MGVNRHPNYARYRVWTLFGVWVFFALHMIHWRLHGTTLAPLELNEVLYTIHQGIVTAGFILMLLIMVATLIFGRFFCSWGCHILSLQDACSWILRKLRIRSHPIRSRTLIWVPMGAMLYLFVWPQVLMLFHGVETEALHVVENTNGEWSSFVTDDFWRNLPPVEIALSTFFIVGFLLVYLMGSRSFCFYGCPYGALFNLADRVAPGRIKLTGDCQQCGVCTVNCTSDILVHREIKEYGMVTNPKCMKDLDCVANCPQNALSFGFRTPPLFRSGFTLPDYGNRYSFTLAEDLMMAVVFILCVFIFRGLYGMIPFLMSVGMAVAMAYMTVLLMRMTVRKSTSINNLRLKLSGRIRVPGHVFLVVAFVVFGLTAHSAIIQYHSFAGSRLYERLGANIASVEEKEGVPLLAERALSHFEKAYGLGLFRPVHLRTQLASIYMIQDEDEKATQQLLTILKQEPGNTNALFRLGILKMETGDAASAIPYFEKAVRTDAHDSEDRALKSAALVELAKHQQRLGNRALALKYLGSAKEENPSNGEAWLMIGMHHFHAGDMQRAILNLNRSLSLNPNSAAIHNNLGAIYARTGQAAEACIHFEALAGLRPVDHRVFYNLGMMKMKLGRSDEARQNLNRALDIDPDYALAAQGLVKLEDAKTLKNDE